MISFVSRIITHVLHTCIHTLSFLLGAVLCWNLSIEKAISCHIFQLYFGSAPHPTAAVRDFFF
jgi:hypothetical protein